MSHKYQVGQLVAVRDDEEEPWQCGRIASVDPILVKRRPRSAPLTFNLVSPLEALDDKDIKGLVGFDQQMRNQLDNGHATPPVGLSPEDQSAYKGMLSKAAWLFANTMLMLAALSPVFFNLVWLTLANVVNKGEDRQDYWWYVLFFDNYFHGCQGWNVHTFLLDVPSQACRGPQAFSFHHVCCDVAVVLILHPSALACLGFAFMGYFEIEFPLGCIHSCFCLDAGLHLRAVQEK